MSIEVRAITKKFSRYPALDRVSLKVESGELIALLGPSGSGKTTLLRIIAGLEFPDDASSRVLFGGTDVTQLTAYKRHAGFVFQHYALFGHMTVFDNVAFGLRVLKSAKRPPADEIARRVRALLEAVQLGGYEKRLPSQLSGGQRQRVAFARALAIEPQVLLLDEPFGALDAKVRKELRRWLREFQDRIKLTTLFVTHDQDEAFEVADRVVIIDKGRVQQIGTPDEVRRAPANAFVADFLDLPTGSVAAPAEPPPLPPPVPRVHGARFLELAAAARAQVRQVRPHEVADALAAGARLIDVREPDEVAQGRIPQSEHLAKGTVEQFIEIAVPDPDTPVICYCAAGNRSALVAETLTRMGYSDVRALSGGIKAWVSAGLPVTAPTRP